AAHLAELDEVLGYADELAAAEHGPDAARAEPIEDLQPTALALPLPWLVDRYVALLEARQQAVMQLIDRDGSQLAMAVVSAQHEVTTTAHRIANVLARAGRPGEIAAHLAPLAGIGADKDLALRATLVADRPTADSYDALARSLAGDPDAPDPAAALAVCLAGLARFPHDAELSGSAAQHAAALGRVDQAIALYEGAIAAQNGEVDAALALRLGKLYAERISRLAYGGRPGAAAAAWQDLARYTASEARRSPGDVWAEVDAIGQSSLGRGLVSQGRLADGERALVASIDRAPSVDAYEALVTIYYKTGRYASATRYASAGLGLLGSDTSADRYHRAKLERLAGDLARAGNQSRDAAALYLDTMRLWTSLGEDRNLPRAIAAERKLEVGRALWFLGDHDKAVDLVLDAVDFDPTSPAICGSAVELLLELGASRYALDALHRGLGSDGLTELNKVYISLWALADARQHGAIADRLATDYLASRHGDLWYERLAEAATGRLDFAELAGAARTAPEQAELAFYGATLGLDPAAHTPAGQRTRLRAVVAAGMVMDAEYDLARLYLGR
ncbi:MAG TPA: hypothetical protein VLX92_35365, partial [Kofleriaceae bacterium]|nr:hypothetical protein [Kofleriaceae bacterium]